MDEFPPAEISDRRTILADDRTLLAAERTYAAWMRTALAALASGVGARTLLKDILPLPLAKLTASFLVIFAGFCVIAAIWRQLQGVRPRRPLDFRPIPHVLIIPMNLFLLIVAIAALIGIWAA
jgi:putative membrane protein